MADAAELTWKPWQRVAKRVISKKLKGEDLHFRRVDYDNGLTAGVKLGDWFGAQGVDGDLPATMREHGLDSTKIGQILGDYIAGVLAWKLSARRRKLELEKSEG